MDLPTVAFDESGNSGCNLLDPDQPVFVLASVHLTSESAASLVGSTPYELKFVKLKRSHSGQRRILELLDSSILSEDHVLLSGYHKPFMAIAKMIDLLVEPLAHLDGIDFYERGANLAMANLLHFTMPTFIGRERFELLRASFVVMVRHPSSETIDCFYGILTDAYDHLKHQKFENILATLLATRSVAEAYCHVWHDTELDPAIPAFVQHASIWTGTLNAKFSIIHDVSKPLAQNQQILEAMMSEEEPKLIGYDRRKMVFPIRASGIDFRNSVDFPQTQIADIIAGSSAYCLCARFHPQQDPFAEALLKTRALSVFCHFLWPVLKVTPQELGTEEVGGTDIHEYIGRYIAGKLDGIPPKGQRNKPSSHV